MLHKKKRSPDKIERKKVCRGKDSYFQSSDPHLRTLPLHHGVRSDLGSNSIMHIGLWNPKIFWICVHYLKPAHCELHFLQNKCHNPIQKKRTGLKIYLEGRGWFCDLVRIWLSWSWSSRCWGCRWGMLLIEIICTKKIKYFSLINNPELVQHPSVSQVS